MIAYLKGEVIDKRENSVVVSAGGVGYEVHMTRFGIEKTPPEGGQAELFISPSFSMYGGTLLYGFSSRAEKELFELFRDSVPDTGAKKAVDYLNKAIRSLPDFKKAVVEKDVKLLVGIFGFTKKTAERLISALKDKMGQLVFEGEARIKSGDSEFDSRPAFSNAANALAALGYSASEVRRALKKVEENGIADGENTESLVRNALKELVS